MSVRVVLADANVLYSRVLRDYLLCAAEQEIVNVNWSQSILDDVTDHLTTNLPGFTFPSAVALTSALSRTFPNAMVEPTEVEFARLAEIALPDEDDRHVIAAALAADADLICTNNTDDFPAAVMKHLGLDLLTPDELLVHLVQVHGQQMLAAHRCAVASNSQFTDQSTIAALRKAGAPKTADLMAQVLGLA